MALSSGRAAGVRPTGAQGGLARELVGGLARELVGGRARMVGGLPIVSPVEAVWVEPEARLGPLH